VATLREIEAEAVGLEFVRRQDDDDVRGLDVVRSASDCMIGLRKGDTT